MPDRLFCPLCGEPSALRSRGDDFECTNCDAALTIAVFATKREPRMCPCGVRLIAAASMGAGRCVFCRKNERATRTTYVEVRD